MTRSFDVITLTGLSALGVHGVFDFEQQQAQLFSVDVSLWIDATQAVLTDAIEHTISYADVAREVVSIIRGPSVHLIETLAARIADTVMTFDGVKGVEVTVHKPHAPIDEDFSDVAVTLRRGSVPQAFPRHDRKANDMTTDRSGKAHVGSAALPPQLATAHFAAPASPASSHHAVLALGGNVGNVPETLRSVVEALIDHRYITVTAVSPLLRTRAVTLGTDKDQADYWNAVVLIETQVSAEELLTITRGIEDRFGRIRRTKWGPRTIDIDLITFDRLRTWDPHLTLPHPRAHQRAFVLAPWLLLDPDAEIPGRGRVDMLLEKAADRDGIRDAVEDWLDDAASVQEESDRYVLENNVATHDGDEEEPETPRSLAVPMIDDVRLKLPHTSVPSRLDLVPEASKVGLAPGDDRDDIVWRELWNRWSKPMDLRDADSAQRRTGPSKASTAGSATPSRLRVPPIQPLGRSVAPTTPRGTDSRDAAATPPPHAIRGGAASAPTAATLSSASGASSIARSARLAPAAPKTPPTASKTMRAPLMSAADTPKRVPEPQKKTSATEAPKRVPVPPQVSPVTMQRPPREAPSASPAPSLARTPQGTPAPQRQRVSQSAPAPARPSMQVASGGTSSAQDSTSARQMPPTRSSALGQRTATQRPAAPVQQAPSMRTSVPVQQTSVTSRASATSAPRSTTPLRPNLKRELRETHGETGRQSPVSTAASAPKRPTVPEVLDRLPKWMAQSSAVQRAVSSEEVAQMPALPSWDFGGREVRIVDEAPNGAIASHDVADTHDVIATPDDTVAARVLRPDLPEDIARGPLDTQSARPRLRRSVTVRPSVTGQIPITKGPEARQ
ncbi:2-amino-4-hydroxy-6-hydroxymethyldihydropteridine diphosphokinase [Schaalia suimastitidis]|uniref:2-amino-4-hydroxy-6- hydroxymethyldihydropteridine diphosphokinase n=1 Tax=Schaalia suimastitidis TaxID=121163 RepID=UPI000410FF76|nr:2-amino-4-hydroxy-6-hydroxymethyldihydropteridine diphosphokinase [Schaalia suimastitidis]